MRPSPDLDDNEFRWADRANTHNAHQATVIQIVLRHGSRVTADKEGFLRSCTLKRILFPRGREKILNRRAHDYPQCWEA